MPALCLASGQRVGNATRQIDRKKLILNDILVRAGGLEPPRAYAQQILSLACLPIPPRPQSLIFTIGPILGLKAVFLTKRLVPYAFYCTDSRILSLQCLPFHRVGQRGRT